MTSPALVTGASGFIGSHLVDALEARGCDVRAMVRRSSNLRYLESKKLVYAALDDVESMTRALAGVEVVYHLAGATAAFSRAGFDAANAVGTANLLLAAARARSAPRRIVYVSSLMAAGPAHPRVARREHHRITSSGTLYGQTKLQGERHAWDAARAGRFEVVIVRPPLVYGPRDEDVLQMIRSAAMHVVAQPGLRPTSISAVHCADLVEGILLAAEKGRPLPSGAADHVLAGGGAPIDDVPAAPDPPAGRGIYYFTDGARHTVASFGHAAAAAMGKRAVTIPIPGLAVLLVGLVNQTIGRARNVLPALTLDKAKGSLAGAWWCDDARARSDLGYVPQFPLREGLADTIAWLNRCRRAV